MKKNIRGTTATLTTLLGIAMSCSAAFAKSPSQKFVVQVPTKAKVTPPPSTSIVHSLLDATQLFPQQSWSVQANSPTGVMVDFEVQQAFTHVDQTAVKGDVQLQIAVASTKGAARWNVTQASDSTSVADNDETAIVQLQSDGAGSADIAVQVGFSSHTVGELVTGDYQTTVVCTLSVP